eukprot:6460313-Ditylum_brightwellii.AAC.1
MDASSPSRPSSSMSMTQKTASSQFDQHLVHPKLTLMHPHLNHLLHLKKSTLQAGYPSARAIKSTHLLYRIADSLFINYINTWAT